MDRVNEQDKKTVPVSDETRSDGTPELQVDEFSIVELEDRLEFLERSDGNCGCPP